MSLTSLSLPQYVAFSMGNRQRGKTGSGFGVSVKLAIALIASHLMSNVDKMLKHSALLAILYKIKYMTICSHT